MRLRSYGGVVIIALVAAGLGSSSCKTNKQPRPDLLGDYESVAAKSTDVLEQSQTNSNKGLIVNRPGIYDSTFQVNTVKGLVYITYPVRNMDASKLKKILSKELLPSEHVEQIEVVEATNSLVLRLARQPKGEATEGTPPAYTELMKMIKSLDERPPQIMVDVNIYRVFGDYTRDVAAILKAESGRSDQFAPSLDVDLPGARLRSPERAKIGGKYGLIARYGATQIEAALDQLESHGYAEDLAQPSLLVSNGNEARVALIEKIPIPRDIVKGDNVVRTTEFEEVENSLQVTPAVRANGLVKLTVSGNISSVDLSGPTQVPNITTRQATVDSVLLKQGQTLTIAGFTSQRTLAVDRGIPILSSIPGLGKLFTGEDREKERSMILFTVTPQYVDVTRNYQKENREKKGKRNDKEEDS